MKNNQFGLKLKPTSVRITFVAFALFLLSAALASFGVIDLTNTFDLVLGVAAVAVIFTEIGIAQVYKTRGKSLDVLSLIGITAGIITLLSVTLEFWSIPWLTNILNPIQGLVYGVLVISFFVEAFR